VRWQLELNNTTAVKKAVLAGHAIGRVPKYLVHEELRSGRLREVLPGVAPAALRSSASTCRAASCPRRCGPSWTSFGRGEASSGWVATGPA